MSGILDIGPLTEEIPLSNTKKLTVYGLKVEDIFWLYNEFQEIKAYLDKRIGDLKPENLVKNSPKVIGAIIACGCGERAKPKTFASAAAVAAKWSVGIQLLVVTKVFTLTFPQGVLQFVEDMRALEKAFKPSPQMTDPQEASEKASVSQLSAALQMDEASRQRYRPRRVN